MVWPQNIEYCSLCYIVGPSCWSILFIIVFNVFYWSTVDLWCCINFCCTEKRFHSISIYIHSLYIGTHSVYVYTHSLYICTHSVYICTHSLHICTHSIYIYIHTLYIYVHILYTYIHTHTHSFYFLFHHSWTTEYWMFLSVLCSRTSLLMHSIYNSWRLLTPDTQSIPPSLPHRVSPWQPQICPLLDIRFSLFIDGFLLGKEEWK